MYADSRLPSVRIGKRCPVPSGWRLGSNSPMNSVMCWHGSIPTSRRKPRRT